MAIVTHAYRPKRAPRNKPKQPALHQVVVSPAPAQKTSQQAIRQGAVKMQTAESQHPTIVTEKRQRNPPFPEAEDFDTEKQRRRGDLAKQLWRDLVRAATGQDPS